MRDLAWSFLSLLQLLFEILSTEADDVPATVDCDGLINELERDLVFVINEPHSGAPLNRFSVDLSFERIVVIVLLELLALERQHFLFTEIIAVALRELGDSSQVFRVGRLTLFRSSQLFEQ